MCLWTAEHRVTSHISRVKHILENARARRHPLLSLFPRWSARFSQNPPPPRFSPGRQALLAAASCPNIPAPRCPYTRQILRQAAPAARCRAILARDVPQAVPGVGRSLRPRQTRTPPLCSRQVLDVDRCGTISPAFRCEMACQSAVQPDRRCRMSRVDVREQPFSDLSLPA